MSTTPSTSDSSPRAYTVVGGAPAREGGEAPGFAIVLLNRGGRPFRPDLFMELDRLGAREIISVESGSQPYDLEGLCRQYDKLRFLLVRDEVSPGERVDYAIEESDSEYVFVLWNDMKLNASSISSRVFGKIAERGRLCTIPAFLDAGGEEIPGCLAPAFDRRRFLRIVPTTPVQDRPGLFPFDYCGIYRRHSFLTLGGYDRNLPHPYWQKMDFGFRAWMWGEQIRAHAALKLQYMGEAPGEDTTLDQSYKRFYLRNLTVRFQGDSGTIPLSRFPGYLTSSRDGLSRAWADFRTARSWVRENRFRYRQDAYGVAESWEYDQP